MPYATACELGMLMRRLWGHEPDLVDGVLAFFDDNAANWADGLPGHLWRLRQLAMRLPKGWRGRNNPDRWLNALHNNIPREVWQWFYDHLVPELKLPTVAMVSRNPTLATNIDTFMRTFNKSDGLKIWTAIYHLRAFSAYGHLEYTYSDSLTYALGREYDLVRGMTWRIIRQGDPEPPPPPRLP